MANMMSRGGAALPAPVVLLAADGAYIAAALSDKVPRVLVFRRDHPAEPPLVLHTHLQRYAPTALAFNPRGVEDGPHTPRLCVGSRDSCVLWDIQDSIESALHGHTPLEPLELTSGQGRVDAVALSKHCQWAAVCSGVRVSVVEVATLAEALRLEGHGGSVVAAFFVSMRLAVACEDRAFYLWDITQGHLLHRSAVLSAAVPTAVTPDPTFPRLALGFADGSLQVIDISSVPTGAARTLHRVDAAKVAARFQAPARDADVASSGLPAPTLVVDAARGVMAPGRAEKTEAPGAPSAEAVPSMLVQAGSMVLSMAYLSRTGAVKDTAGCGEALSSTAGEGDSVGQVLAPAPTLAVALPSGVALFQANTMELLGVEPFHDGGAAATCVLHAGPGRDGVVPQATCVCGPAFVPCLRVYEVACTSTPGTMASSADPAGLHGVATRVATLGIAGPGSEGAGDPDAAATAPLSIFPTAPLPDTSPLAQRRFSERSASSSSSRSEPPGRKPRAPLSDRPVTFHSNVKSSGYGLTHPKQRLGQRPGAPQRSKSVGVTSRGPKGVGAAALSRRYPVDCGAISTPQPQHVLPNGAPVHAGAALRVAYAPDGSRLVSCGTDRAARALRLPIARHAGDGSTFIGHNAPVVAASWSSASDMVLTGSMDATARLWAVGKSDPLLVLSPSTSGNARDTGPPSVSHEVTAARFLHLDKFLLVASGPSVHVYRYGLGADTAKNDLERLRNSNHARCVWTFKTGSQTVLDAACPNSFVSHLVICAGSSRALDVVDLAAGRTARTVPDAHARPPARVVLNEVSPFASHPASAYNLFATTAPDGCAKLWDLRDTRCVRSLSAHANRQVSVGAAFSPCMRYLAVGSEDKTACVYDLRTGLVCDKLRGHGDAVVDVAYHPLHPQLVTAGLDGHLRFFADTDGP